MKQFLQNLWKKEGGKKLLRPEVISSFLWGLTAIVFCVMWFTGEEEQGSQVDSVEEHSPSEKLSQEEIKNEEVMAFPASNVEGMASTTKRKRRTAKKAFVYPTKSQVIVRQDEKSDKVETIPAGTSAVGKMLNAIDTRTLALARVLLPYGITHKQVSKIPRNSVAVGMPLFQESGRIVINFQKIIFPNGDSFDFKAQALDAQDFSAGIEGHYHNNLDSKIAVASGLSLASRISGILAQKESLGGEYGRITVKSNLKDAALDGVSQVLDEEAKRQLDMAQREAQTAYITLNRDKELIVSLTEDFEFGMMTGRGNGP